MWFYYFSCNLFLNSNSKFFSWCFETFSKISQILKQLNPWMTQVIMEQRHLREEWLGMMTRWWGANDSIQRWPLCGVWSGDWATGERNEIIHDSKPSSVPHYSSVLVLTIVFVTFMSSWQQVVMTSVKGRTKFLGYLGLYFFLKYFSLALFSIFLLY